MDRSARTRRQLLRTVGAAPFVALGASVALSALTARPAEAGMLPVPPKPPSPPTPRVACFVAGTRISTPSGTRCVEELRIGDEVETASGPKPIKWIGRRTFARPTHGMWPDQVIPIRITRSAISDNSPSRDLYVSPAHAVLVDGVLIPAMHLINGTTIMPSVPTGTVEIEYLHIEFESHEIVYAEGAAVESFLDEGGSRDGFANRDEYERLYGADENAVPMVACAPVLKYSGRGEAMIGRVRSAISTVVDVRDPIQIACDRIAERAEAALS